MDGLERSTWFWLVLRARVVLSGWASSRRARSVGAVLCFVVVDASIWLGYAHCDCLFKPYDDAYITYRYARNLATGQGLVFNPGEATDSASSFLYTLLLAAFYRAGAHDLPLVGTLFGTACAAALAAIVYCASVQRSYRPLLSAVLAVAAGCNGLIAGWAVSGMETAFFALLITWAVWRVLLLGKHGWPEAALMLAIALTRFEGLLLVGAWCGLLLVYAWRGDARLRRSSAAQSGMVFGGFAVFLLWKRLRYGTFLPDAFALKQITPLYAPDADALWHDWRYSAPVLLLLSAAGLWRLSRRPEHAALIGYCALTVASLVLGPRADWARYSAHMIPVAAMLASVPLAILARELPVLALAATLLLGKESFDSFVAHRESQQHGARHQACRTRVGEYLEREVGAGEWVLSSDIGGIAYAAPNVRFIDTVGLTSKDILHARARGETMDAVLFAKRPLLIADTCHKSCRSPKNYASLAWMADPGFWLTPLGKENYSSRLKNGRVLERCRTGDGLSFAVIRFDYDELAESER